MEKRKEIISGIVMAYLQPDDTQNIPNIYTIHIRPGKEVENDTNEPFGKKWSSQSITKSINIYFLRE